MDSSFFAPPIYTFQDLFHAPFTDQNPIGQADIQSV